MRPAILRRLLPALALLSWPWPAPAQEVATFAEAPPAVATATEIGRAPAAACSGIALRSTPAFLFADGFESGDISAWSAGAIARFSARRILDLEFAVELDAGVTGDHLLRLDLETPRGHLYQRLTAAFATTAAAPRTRRVEGYPRPLAVQVSTARAPATGAPAFEGPQSPPAVGLSFPVAGTSIVHSSLYGTWRARPFLDDSITPCGDALTFVLDP